MDSPPLFPAAPKDLPFFSGKNAKPKEPLFVPTDANALGVALTTHTAYIADADSLLWVDITDPKLPGTPQLVADHQHISRVDIIDNIAYVVHQAGLWLVDVRSPQNPVSLAHVSIDGIADFQVNGDAIYVNNNQRILHSQAPPRHPVAKPPHSGTRSYAGAIPSGGAICQKAPPSKSTASLRRGVAPCPRSIKPNSPLP